MRFAFSPDQELLRNSVRDVLKRECSPAIVRGAWTGAPAHALWQTLAGLGTAGLMLPEEVGGLGLGAVEQVAVLEECGRFAAPVPLLETGMVAAPLLGAIGDAAFQRRWSTAVASGDATISVGLAATPLVRDAGSASLLLLESHGELHAVAREDVSLRAELSVDRSRHLWRVEWSPRDATRVATGPNARRVLDEAFDRGALGASAELLGLSQHMIEMTVEYTKVRRQFGSAVGSFQAVKHHLADALLKLEFARPAVYRAAFSLAHADPDRAVHVSMAKACASDAATFVARVALQCHGAIGYSFEHDLHLWMKRAWALASSWGDATWHRTRVSHAILGPSSASAAV